MNTVERLLEGGLERIKVAWFRSNTAGLLMAAVLEDGTVVVEDEVAVLPEKCYCLASSVSHDQRAADYIRRAIGLPVPERDPDDGWASAEDIWRVNDRWPADATGRAKAIAVMEKAIELAKAAA